MKILHINSVYRSGSTGKIVANIHAELLNQGEESFVVFGRKSCDSATDSKSLRMTSRFGNYWHVLMSRTTGKHGLFSTRETKKLIKKIEEYKPDLIHLHNIHGYYLNYKVLFKYLRRYNGSIIWTLHDCWAYTGQCTHYSYVNCKKFITGCGNCPQVSRYPKAYIDSSKSNYKLKKKYFTNISNLYIVTPSNWLKNEVSQSFLSDYTCITVDNGVQLNNEEILRKNTGQNTIVSVASIWDDRKGLDDFIQLSNYLDSKWEILLVGLNKKQIRNLPKNIKGVERVNNPIALMKIYAKSDLYVGMSKEETFGMTYVEAASAGLKSVAYNATAIPETLSKIGGAVFAVRDFDSIARFINQYDKKLDSFDYRRSAEKFSIKNMVNTYVALYRMILSEVENEDYIFNEFD